MQNSTKNVCRCCLNLVHSTNVGFMNEVMRKMFSLLLIKLDLDVSEHPLVCDMCSEVLDEIFSFKSKCLSTEDILTTQIDTNSKVNLPDILIEIENKRNIHIGKDEVVCRLCIEIPLNGSYIDLGETGDGISFVRDMIQIHLPEMDLSISEKPIICETCHLELEKYASFAANCMNIEEKIKLYCDQEKVHVPVDLARVLHFMADEALDLQNSLNKDLIIKQEDDSLMVKIEEVQDAVDYILGDHLVDSTSTSEFYLKNEEIKIESENDEMSEEIEDSIPTVAPNNSWKSGSLKRKGQIRKSPLKGRKHLSSGDHMETFGSREFTLKTDKDKSEVMHKCDNCEFETRHKSSIARHMYKHRDPRAERKFKCDKCPFETDFKHHLFRHNLRHKDTLEVEMYKCAHCEYDTIQKCSLNRHMLAYHRDPKAERKFKCDKCTFQTDFKYHLLRHNLRHKAKLEVEMYKCANCEFETRYKSSLIQHVLKHRDPRSEREFKCDKCSYETDIKSSLSRHNVRHKDKSEVEMYKCERCEYESRYKCSMVKHMRRKHCDPKAERKF